jgi:hypothetical protein
VREEAFLEVKPDALHRVQFGRVGRQRHQRDVGGNGKAVRAVPACLVEYHHRMFVMGDRLGEAVEKDLHCCRIGIGHHQREGIVRARLNGCEDIGKGEALVAQAWRAFAALPPDMADTALLADACLILEEQAYSLAFIRTLNFFQKRWRSF